MTSKMKLFEPNFVRYTVVYCSSQEDRAPVKNLELHPFHDISKQVWENNGWISSRYCQWPQQIVLRFDDSVLLQNIRLISHEHCISSKIEISIGVGEDHHLTQFRRVTAVYFSSNTQTGYTARQMKELELNGIANMVKLVFHQNHATKPNVYDQVGLVSIQLEGVDPAESDKINPLDKYKNTALYEKQRKAGNIPLAQALGEQYTGIDWDRQALDLGGRLSLKLPTGITKGVGGKSKQEEGATEVDKVLMELGLPLELVAATRPKVVLDDTTERILKVIRAEKMDAINQNNYDHAAICADQIEELEKLGSDLIQLEERKRFAVASDDFRTASTAKKMAESLLERREVIAHDGTNPARIAALITPPPTPEIPEGLSRPPSEMSSMFASRPGTVSSDDESPFAQFMKAHNRIMSADKEKKERQKAKARQRELDEQKAMMDRRRRNRPGALTERNLAALGGRRRPSISRDTMGSALTGSDMEEDENEDDAFPNSTAVSPEKERLSGSEEDDEYSKLINSAANATTYTAEDSASNSVKDQEQRVNANEDDVDNGSNTKASEKEEKEAREEDEDDVVIVVDSDAEAEDDVVKDKDDEKEKEKMKKKKKKDNENENKEEEVKTDADEAGDSSKSGKSSGKAAEERGDEAGDNEGGDSKDRKDGTEKDEDEDEDEDAVIVVDSDEDGDTEKSSSNVEAKDKDNAATDSDGKSGEVGKSEEAKAGEEGNEEDANDAKDAQDVNSEKNTRGKAKEAGKSAVASAEVDGNGENALKSANADDDAVGDDEKKTEAEAEASVKSSDDDSKAAGAKEQAPTKAEPLESEVKGPSLKKEEMLQVPQTNEGKVDAEKVDEQRPTVDDDALAWLNDIGMGACAELLARDGYQSLEDIRDLEKSDLVAIEGMKPGNAKRILRKINAEKKAAEDKRVEDERRMKEEKRIAEEKRVADEKRASAERAAAKEEQEAKKREAQMKKEAKQAKKDEAEFSKVRQIRKLPVPKIEVVEGDPLVKAVQTWLKRASKSMQMTLEIPNILAGSERSELTDSIAVFGEAVPACVCSKQWKVREGGYAVTYDFLNHLKAKPGALLLGGSTLVAHGLRDKNPAVFEAAASLQSKVYDPAQWSEEQAPFLDHSITLIGPTLVHRTGDNNAKIRSRSIAALLELASMKHVGPDKLGIFIWNAQNQATSVKAAIGILMLLTELIYQNGFSESSKGHGLTFPRTMHAIVSALRHPRAAVRGHACELAVAVHHAVGSAKFEPHLTKLRLSTINALGAALLEAYNQRAERDKLPPLEVWKWQDARLLTHIALEKEHMKNPNRDKKSAVNKTPFLARGGGTHAAAAAAQVHHENMQKVRPRELPKRKSMITAKSKVRSGRSEPPLQHAPMNGVKSYHLPPGASPTAPGKPKPARRGGRAAKNEAVSIAKAGSTKKDKSGSGAGAGADKKSDKDGKTSSGHKHGHKHKHRHSSKHENKHHKKKSHSKGHSSSGGRVVISVEKGTALPTIADDGGKTFPIVVKSAAGSESKFSPGDRISSVAGKDVTGLGLMDVQKLLAAAMKKMPFSIESPLWDAKRSAPFSDQEISSPFASPSALAMLDELEAYVTY
eukprot:g299.t1